MDCKTARLFLAFARPHGGELDPADADAVEGHLAGCPDCAAAAGAERRLDDCLGRAVRAVPVPDGLRGQLLARLAAERNDHHRRWVGHALRGVAAAACVLLVGWGVWAYATRARQRVDVEAMLQRVTYTRPSPDEVNESFQRLGVTTEVPRSFDYGLLANHGVAELPGHPGTKVPQLTFNDKDRRAVIYVLSSKRFDTRALADLPDVAPGYSYKVHVEQGPGERYAYLILHTGDGVEWMRLQRGNANSPPR